VGDECVVESEKGVVYGKVAEKPKLMPVCKLKQPLRKVVRLTGDADEVAISNKKATEKEAYDFCLSRVAHRGLKMKLVSVEFLEHHHKAIFYFTSDGRVDFRGLVKDLAQKFKTRIEMRQIGVRDEAKMLGGIGPCGRKLCCATFMNNFEPVTIRMAKDQNLPLNPSKISGLCGRLMCCLSFEHQCYKKLKGELPRPGDCMSTKEGKGVVVKTYLLKEKVILELEDGRRIEVSCSECTKQPRTQRNNHRAHRKAAED
jgi:cell fate regulator YaaT (PSP1 superfamily)